MKKDNYSISRGMPGPGAASLVPDSANPKSPFADVRVRQAAQYAIDAETIANMLFYGEAEPANQWIYKEHWGYNPNVVGYPYNPTKAKQLLAEAGYPNGFKTKCLYITNPQDDKIFTAVQGLLKAVGIAVELDPADPARWTQIAWKGGKWEGLVFGPYSSTPDLVAALERQYSGGGMYYTQMLLPDDYLKAIQNAVSAPNFESKQKWVQEAMKLMIDKYCLQIMIYTEYRNFVGQTYVHNHGFFETPNAALWKPEDTWLEK